MSHLLASYVVHPELLNRAQIIISIDFNANFIAMSRSGMIVVVPPSENKNPV